MTLESRIEGVLFYIAEPTTIAKLASICESSKEDVVAALTTLSEVLRERGMILVQQDETVELMTAPALAPTIERLRKEELRREIGKAGAETLAIILYNDLVTRAEIDFIRGVNSTFILRNLLVRGLIERVTHPEDQRAYAYKPTIALYAHLGIQKKEDLPNYHEMTEAIAKYRAAQTEEVVHGEPEAETV